ncbi:hypothetical protein NHL50_15770 [Acidimicrobiia bacterium EGI L10123]|uniref:hypothetical protein n=1 Tax=Salinilacustrithrix flava TaxID=2957203 RepID=UPI003D7C342D|nr:hypothetical protein [Acidimicrobiia bacterium EGI L10123]
MIDDSGATTVQARLEAHPVGRLVISAFLVVLLAAMVVSNLPRSELKRQTLPLVEPVLDVTALTQNWSLFAPQTRTTTLRLAARMTYADGSTDHWYQPHGNPVFGPYRAYRWRKLANNVLTDHRPDLWADLTAWVARNHRREGQTPIAVTLLRQYSVTPTPGSGERVRPGWRQDELYRAVRPSGGTW